MALSIRCERCELVVPGPDAQLNPRGGALVCARCACAIHADLEVERRAALGLTQAEVPRREGDHPVLGATYTGADLVSGVLTLFQLLG